VIAYEWREALGGWGETGVPPQGDAVDATAVPARADAQQMAGLL